MAKSNEATKAIGNKATDQDMKEKWNDSREAKSRELIATLSKGFTVPQLVIDSAIRGMSDYIQNEVQKSKTTDKVKVFLFPTYSSRINFLDTLSADKLSSVGRLDKNQLQALIEIAVHQGTIDMTTAFRTVGKGYTAMRDLLAENGLI